MKIARLELFPLRGATVDGGWPEGHGEEDPLHTLVRVESDVGLEGWGSCFTSGSLVGAAMELIWPLLRGDSAEEPERVTEKLRQSTFWQGRGGAVEHAISGIDLALWDLMGKRCDQPVSRLLGGSYRSSIRPYASTLFDAPERLVGTLEQLTAAGYRAIKLGWRPFGRKNRGYDELLVRTAREAVGDEVELMVDAGGSEAFWPHGCNWARETARMLADYRIAWFEEPLPPDDLDGYRRLTETSPVPIAGGEVLTRRQAFRPWIERHAVDIIQPDCTKNGGLSESRRIAWLAAEHNVRVVPHGWNTAVGLAADLQFVAALPVASHVEFLTPCAYIDDLVRPSFELNDDGELEIPSSPGFGIEIDRTALKRLSGEPRVYQ